MRCAHGSSQLQGRRSAEWLREAGAFPLLHGSRRRGRWNEISFRNCTRVGREKKALGMIKHYNEIAGRNVDRLAALSDGIFAFAMTLLALDLRPPDFVQDLHSEHALLAELSHKLLPRLIPYLMSFMTLGIFWVGQQTD